MTDALQAVVHRGVVQPGDLDTQADDQYVGTAH